MRVQALTNGYYCERRVRRGEVFDLVERNEKRRDEKTGKLVAFHLTPEQQFSERWMRKVAGKVEPLNDEEQDLNLPGVKIRRPKKNRNEAMSLSESESVI